MIPTKRVKGKREQEAHVPIFMQILKTHTHTRGGRERKVCV